MSNTIIRCAIIDDEQPARELLQNFCGKIPELHVIGKFKSPVQALPLINENKLDLIFLDIQMPDIKGTDFLKSLKNGPVVIFSTAYSDYALEGYNLNVSDYLLKPFSFERFLQAVNKATEIIRAKTNPVLNEEVLSIAADHRIYRIKHSDILYIEGLREYVSFYTLTGKRIISLQSLKGLQKKLPSSSFVRSHRSYIVRKDKIDYIEGNSLFLGNKSIPIGKSYKKEVLEALNVG